MDTYLLFLKFKNDLKCNFDQLHKPQIIISILWDSVIFHCLKYCIIISHNFLYIYLNIDEMLGSEGNFAIVKLK